MLSQKLMKIIRHKFALTCAGIGLYCNNRLLWCWIHVLRDCGNMRKR